MADVKKAFEEWAENAELKNRGINKEEARKVFYDGFNIGSEQTFEEDMEVFNLYGAKVRR